ncbi:MAG: hypothetical protein VYE22_32990 [Myxococcota bacterium]|nr:hypothetical protein [Myxococcota bacterium]
MRTLRALTPALLLFGALLVPRPAPAQDDADPQWTQHRQAFQGTWELAIPQARARAIVDRAIDQTVNAMSFFVRGIARPMLRDNTPVNETIALTFADDARRITVVFDGRHRYTTPLGQTRTGRDFEGDELQVTQRFRGDDLEQVFQADQGTRWNVYSLEREGRMTVTATTQGDMMPQPMRFTLPYRRR